MTGNWRRWSFNGVKLRRKAYTRIPHDLTSGRGSEPGIPTASSRAIKEAIEDAYGRKPTDQL